MPTVYTWPVAPATPTPPVPPITVPTPPEATSVLTGLLTAFSHYVEVLGSGASSEARRLRDMAVLRFATGDELARVAFGYGLNRELLGAFSDDQFRELAMEVAFSGKITRALMYKALRIVYPSVILLESTSKLILVVLGVLPQEGNLDNATYLHDSAAEASASSWPGDYLVDTVAVDGSTVAYQVVVLWSNTYLRQSVENLVFILKAAGVWMTTDPLGYSAPQGAIYSGEL